MPTMRVIIGATVSFIQQSSLPELQGNDELFQATKIVTILQRSYWHITVRCCNFCVQALSRYSCSISDKELTRQSVLLDLLERDNSIMAYMGLDILEDLAPRRVRLLHVTFLFSSWQDSA